MSYVVQHWSFDPFFVAVIGVVVLNEVGLARLRARSLPAHSRRRRLQSIWFYAGLGVLLVAVQSPIDYWSSSYFFVHMVEHLLIAFYAPMLIVAGAPWISLLHGLPVTVRRRVGRAVLLGSRTRPLRTIGRFLVNPWTALVSFNAVMVIWHVPGLFDAAERSQALHVWVMHASLFLTGVLFWLQIIPSRPFRIKVTPYWQAGAIISTNVVMFVLAMSLSLFTSTSWYEVYANVPGVTLSPFADQQLGAAILWICGDFWAIPALVIVIRRAIDEEGSLSEVLERLTTRHGLGPRDVRLDRADT